MTRQKYSAKEALNRILRLLQGNPPSSDVPGEVTGDMRSEDRAFSDIAELLARSLPDEYTALPWMEYGQIYGVSGSSIGMDDAQWKRLPFSNDGESSDRVTPNQANNRVTIADQGTYFVDYQVSYLLDVERRLVFRAEWNQTGQDQLRADDTALTGTYNHISAGGFITVDSDEANDQDVELYAWSENGTGTLTVLDAQLNVRKVY